MVVIHMAKSRQQKYEEAVERNLRNLPRRIAAGQRRDKFKSLEEAKRILGARERDTQFDAEIRQFVEA
jgi:hypothetical protein